jgi:hypothetical protein
VFPYFYHPYSDPKSRALGLATLEKISKIYLDTDVRFAALIGGLYFYNTIKNNENINKLIHEFPLPGSCKKLIKLITDIQYDCHNSLQLKKEKLLQLLRKLDTRRSPKRTKVLLKICEAIYTSVHKDEYYKQKDFIQIAAEEIEKVNIDTWIREKVSAKQLAANLHNAQLQLLENLIQNYK